MTYRSLHFIGVLTPEMAGLAVYAIHHGIKVTASDDHSDDLFLPILEHYGVTFFDMFAQTNVSRTTDAVVLSRYYDERHTEASTAEKLQIPILHEVALLHEISEPSPRWVVMDEYDGPLIATWLTHVLNSAKYPTQTISGTVGVTPEASLASVKEGEQFILPLPGFKRDAGTFEPDFLSFTAETLIIPSIRYNYPELHMTLDDVYQAYYTFAKRIPRKGLIIGNSDYSRMKRLRLHLADRHIETYGFEYDAQWHIREVTSTDEGTSFSLASNRKMYGPFVIPFYGSHFVSAATAVAVTCLLHDVPIQAVADGLKTVPLLRRYGEEWTDKEGRIIVDDRADNPETIQAVIAAVKERYPEKRIWCVYQPGSYLRTKALAHDLQTALSPVDFLYVADIKGYPKEKSEGLHSRNFVAEMRQSHAQTYYMENPQELGQLLVSRVPSTDCIVNLGSDGFVHEVLKSFVRQDPAVVPAA